MELTTTTQATTQEQTKMVVYYHEIKTQNQKIIDDYIQARKTESNLASSTQVVTSDNLNRFSRYVKKNFKDVTRHDIILFLNFAENNATNEKM
jgi:site-specific recombinase XerD